MTKHYETSHVENTDKEVEEVPVSTVECSQCGHTAINLKELDKHRKVKHTNKEQTRKSNSDIECTNGTSCRWNRQGRCNFMHKKDAEYAPNVGNTKDCKHGEACVFKSQGRCNFYHKDVGVQLVRKQKTPVPSLTSSNNTWHTVPQRSRHNQDNTVPHVWQQGQQQHSSRPSVWTQNQQQRDNVPFMWQQGQRSEQAQAWCQHGVSCNLGQYCLLRHFSDEDFCQMQKQMRN